MFDDFLNLITDQHQDDRSKKHRSGSEEALEHSEIVARELLSQQRQIQHLTLLCQSMWELLRDHTGLTDKELSSKVADVDARDGKADGKISKQVFACPSCGKNCNTSSQKCIWCGEDLLLHKPHIFEG